MNATLALMLQALAQAPETPGFQGLIISPSGRVQVVYQHGLLSFRSVETLQLAIGLATAIRKPDQSEPLASVS